MRHIPYLRILGVVQHFGLGAQCRARAAEALEVPGFGAHLNLPCAITTKDLEPVLSRFTGIQEWRGLRASSRA